MKLGDDFFTRLFEWDVAHSFYNERNKINYANKISIPCNRSDFSIKFL